MKTKYKTDSLNLELSVKNTIINKLIYVKIKYSLRLSSKINIVLTKRGRTLKALTET